ncbi:preprotein translocase YidC [Novosphingobium sp. AAP83]|uniref:membrane protein insertase YidC n=1 Tax=Novosphingobium sp. AAP83 TaxID=1523425 RepID=UPI0006B9BF29|nr:membrane protein insertase YidC [Novosphingobium sp. AAP83]KPF92231.1 preprotein translocase YidC [Novosphingobium sp. AAP83]
MQNQRNIILAVVLTGLLLLGWESAMRWFYPQAGKRPAAVATAPADPANPAKPSREGGLLNPADVALEKKDLRAELAAGHRVVIDAPGLKGSINLKGALLDDVSMARHRETVDRASAPVRLFSPAGTPAQHFAQIGWVGEGVAAPDAKTTWTAEGAKLTPQTPVTLRWSNTTGQTYSIRYAIDADYMITTTQSVANASTAPVVVRPFALVNRTEKTSSIDTWQLHSGPIGAFDGSVNFENNYSTVSEAPGAAIPLKGLANWIGFTDIYWMSGLIPDANAKAESAFRALGNGIFRADLIYPSVSVAPGKVQSQNVRIFAGAKENAVLEKYEAAGVTNFSYSIDWGWFSWFEKPIFWLLDSIFNKVGNFGLAIILLTLVVRGVMFPIAQRQFASMAAMRALQPKMKALQERYKDDKQTQQQKIMELYKEEKVNPLAGCLPIFLQIPVFFALYKVLTLTIEMRHQPFVLWIKDLSAPDPAHVLNLFGLLPFDPPSFLAIGILAILLGITMWLQFKLQPVAMDPAQQQIFAFMPWIMMFVMAPFAAGLLLYWITSNLLTIAQQKYLYSKHPQLKAQVDKDQTDVTRAVTREQKAASTRKPKTP